MNSLRKMFLPRLHQVPLRQVLILPFLLQIFAVVGLVGYLSYRSGQQAVTNLANQLMEETGQNVSNRLDAFLEIPKHLVELNRNSLEAGELEINDFDQLEQQFFRQVQAFPSITTMNFANTSGEIVAAGRDRFGLFPIPPDTIVTWDALGDVPNIRRFYQVDERRNRLKVVHTTPEFNAHQRIWYQIAKDANQPNWTPIFPVLNLPIASITMTTPIYVNEEFRGVLSSDVLLEDLNIFLNNLEFSKSGQVFILENSGNLVATSTLEQPFIENINGIKLVRLNAVESDDWLTQTTAQALLHQGQNGDTRNFSFVSNAPPKTQQGKRQRYFVNTVPYQDKDGLDWLIVVVIPESDFMAEIYANTRITIFLCLLALLVATILGVFTARWITQPILKLNQAAKNLREGQWEQEAEVHSSRQDELGELAQSFSTMATQLQAAFKTLEQRVSERTVELTESNRQLAVAKEKAEVANQAKSAFIANMSHELRSPLNAILGFSYLLTRAPELPPDHRNNIRIINQSGEHLLSLINNVLDLSKIEAGKTTLNLQNFDLWNLLDQTADMFRLRAENQGLQLLLERGSNVPRYLYTDLLKLRQVLINLLNNALKFTTEGSVTLRVNSHSSFVNGQANDQQPTTNNQKITDDQEPITNNKQQTTNNKQPITIQFEVEDTGSGIATEEQEQLFQAFSQTQTGKDTQEGTGLGLAISRQFVQLMGGEIKVNSQVGVGSNFIFDIQAPLGDTNKIAPNQPTRKIVALAPNQPRYKILVVDDKATNRQLLIQLLNPLGFLLREATNGQEAIAIWQEWEPDLIFMDMQMPVMDGYEATKQIKSTARGQVTAVIAFTASVLEEHKAVVLDIGCDDFVPKPFHETDIFEKMNKHLGVSYLYEEDNRQIYHHQQADSTQQMTALLAPTNLAILPKDLLHALEAAAIRSKMTQVNSLIEEVRTLNTPLADALATLAHGFKYHIIASLIKQATQCNVK